MLQLQIKQAGEEREELDKQLPRGGGPIASATGGGRAGTGGTRRNPPPGCQMPGHPGRDRGRHRLCRPSGNGTGRGPAALERGRFGRRITQGTRAEAGPRNGGLRRFRSRNPRAAGPPREELDQRTRELDGVTGRIAKLVRDAGVDIGQQTPVEQLRTLTQQVSQQEARFIAARRSAGSCGRFAANRQRARSGDKPVETRSPSLLERAGVKDEQELRQRAAQQARTASLWQEREDLQREIEAAIAGHCPEETVGQQMEGDPVALESRRAIGKTATGLRGPGPTTFRETRAVQRTNEGPGGESHAGGQTA